MRSRKARVATWLGVAGSGALLASPGLGFSPGGTGLVPLVAALVVATAALWAMGSGWAAAAPAAEPARVGLGLGIGIAVQLALIAGFGIDRTGAITGIPCDWAGVGQAPPLVGRGDVLITALVLAGVGNALAGGLVLYGFVQRQIAERLRSPAGQVLSVAAVAGIAALAGVGGPVPQIGGAILCAGLALIHRAGGNVALPIAVRFGFDATLLIGLYVTGS